MDSLNTKNLDLFETQKQIVAQILDEKRQSGEIKSDEEYNAQYEYILGQIKSGEPLTKLRPQSEITNAKNFNDTFEEVAIDIMTGFTQINNVDQTVNKHQQLNQSIINNLKLSINKASDELDRYEILAETIGSEDFYLEAFRDSNSFDTDNELYAERDGTLLPPDYHLRLDIDREALKLPAIVSENVMIGASGVRLGTIKIGKQLGSGLIRIQNPEHSVDKAIDSSFETFWSETILADEPIKVKMDRNYHNISYGALCELLVHFDYMTQLNEISFIPFCEFPMTIEAIEYYETDNTTEAPKRIPVEKGFSDSGVVYQFNDVYAKRLRIILNQVHFTKTDFIVNNQESEQLKLWYAAKEELEPDALEVNPDFKAKPLYQNKSETSRGYTYFQKALKGMSLELDEIIGKQSDKTVTPMTKYSYTYGLYNVGFRRNEYQNKGIYVSKPIAINGNLKSMMITTTEEHPEVSGLSFTDIEYYVAMDTDPDNWMPIVPFNSVSIKAELLSPVLVVSEYVATLRFTPDGAVRVRKNGVEIYEVMGDFIVNGKDITIRNYDVSATYTAEYAPMVSSSRIDFLKLYTKNGNVIPERAFEEFYGTNALGEITLEHYPFVDRAKLNQQRDEWEPSFLSNDYLPIKVKIIQDNGLHIDQPFDANATGPMIKNATNYFDSEQGTLPPYDEAQGYRYKVENNKIIFNTPIPETSRVIVEYPHLVSAVRLKAIMRRNINSFHGLTPILSDYAVHYQRLL